MNTTKEIKIENVFSEAKIKLVKDFIKSKSKEQTKERLLRNELLAIQYKIEDYIERDNKHY